MFKDIIVQLFASKKEDTEENLQNPEVMSVKVQEENLDDLPDEFPTETHDGIYGAFYNDTYES